MDPFSFRLLDNSVELRLAYYDPSFDFEAPLLNQLNCSSGKQALSSLSGEQLGMLSNVLDPSHWAMRFKRQPKDIELIKNIAKKAML